MPKATTQAEDVAKLGLKEIESYGLADLQCDISMPVFDEVGAGDGIQAQC
ncbi:hypothetical protein GUY44_04280 [Pimelobacter simplex]|nr:hypothetical protein [Pimelobacter simplex]MCG8149685.1 hypothetical protein [Pimelobacter simplex]GEB15952.1 hypothetical protein NSI01_42670 [Pimelobacter simplex]SFM82957.1 hypothetical protein SAMN05421671_3563 [Pimelobacter simplex]